MEFWSVKAIESDAGLDVLDSLSTYIVNTPVIHLDELIVFFKEKGFLPHNNGHDFYYDISAIAIAELLFEYLDTGTLEYEGAKAIAAWHYSSKDIDYLKDFIESICYNKQNHTEIHSFWENNAEWQAHIESLIKKLSLLKTE